MFWLSFGAVARVRTTVEPDTETPLIVFDVQEPPSDDWYSSVASAAVPDRVLFQPAEL